MDYIIKNVFMNNNNRKESRVCTGEFVEFIRTPKNYAYPGLGW